jgi:hypothetical protein
LYIDWSVESVRRIKTTKNKKGDPAGVLRNREKYFLDCLVSDGTEGILSTFFVGNSIPAVSTNIILSETDQFSTKYLCGLLNSSLMSYIMTNCVNASLKGMSSHVTPMDIRRLPFVSPTKSQMSKVENLVNKLVVDYQDDPFLVSNANQKSLDNLIFEIYNINDDAKVVVTDWYTTRREKGINGRASDRTQDNDEAA